MRNAAVTKANILHAAEEEFAAKGIYGARIDEIALRAGSNKRMIYAYYGSKEELYLAVLQNAYNRLSIKEEFILNEDTDCVTAIGNILRMYYEFLSKDQNFVSLIMWENLNQAEYMKRAESFQDLKNPLLHSLNHVISRGKTQGVFRQDIDEEQVAVLLITLSFSYFSNMYTLSYLMDTDLSAPARIEQRVTMVTQMVTEYLKAK